MTSDQKLEVARALARLGVDVIEAGFPAASPDDLAAVRRIAEQVGRIDRAPIVCALARANEADIDQAWEALRAAARPRIHTFLATCDLHMEHKLRMTRAEVLERVRATVGYAQALCDDVEFSPEDAGRTAPAFLHEVLDVAIRAGATTLNIPDTVGYTTPGRVRRADPRHPRAAYPGVEGVILVRALPRRPRAGDGQRPGGPRRGRAPGRGDDQRHRRARGQLRRSRRSSWHCDTRAKLRAAHGHRHDAARRASAAW